MDTPSRAQPPPTRGDNVFRTAHVAALRVSRYFESTLTTTFASGLPNLVAASSIQARVSEISLVDGLRYVTALSSVMLSRRDDQQAIANPINVTLLAKAFILWANPTGGRPLRLTGGADDEGGWPLRAFNSLEWYAPSASAADANEEITAFLIRQAYIGYAIDDPLDAKIGRAWMMFHNLVREGGLRVSDPSGELEKVLGVRAEDLWLLGMAIWAYQVTKSEANANQWLIEPETFVREGPNQAEINAKLAQAFERTSLTPAGYRERYADATSKYRDAASRDTEWPSEFNILRDFPNVALEEEPLPRLTRPSRLLVLWTVSTST